MTMTPSLRKFALTAHVTPYGKRTQLEQRTLSQRPYIPSQRPSFDSNADTGVWPAAPRTITLPRTHMFGIVVIILLLHFVILHFTGVGLGGH